MTALEPSVEPRFTLLAKAMRTLVDLLHTEQGYARIFHDQEGFSYELHSYRQPPMVDLFTRMLGYASATAATQAARETLSAMHAPARGRSNKGRTRARRIPPPEATQLILPVSVC